MTILDKENAILAGQAAQGQILSQIAQAIAGLVPDHVDLTPLQDAIAAVDAHVGQVQALIGTDAAPTPEPTAIPTAIPTSEPASTPEPTITPEV